MSACVALIHIANICTVSHSTKCGHLFHDRAGGIGSSPKWVQKTLGFWPSCALDVKKNRDFNRESVVPNV